MSTTLLTVGLACIMAAIVGGGLKAFQIEIPALRSLTRQVMLATFGLALLLAAYAIQQSAKPKPQPSPLPQLTMSTWTLHDAIDETGTDYSGSTLKFEHQDESKDGLEFKGFFEWMVRGQRRGTEVFTGHYDRSTRILMFEGHETSNPSVLTPGSYSAVLSEDLRVLRDGTWGNVENKPTGYTGHWIATR